MTKLFRAYEVDEDTPVQFVGVYVTKWRAEWGEPEIMFAEVNEPVYDAAGDLLEACKRYFNPMTGVRPSVHRPGWYCVHCNGVSQYPDKFEHDDGCMVKQVHDAIAKARGQQ